MAFNNIPPELLLFVADNLSLTDIVNFRLTCYCVCNVLTPMFQKLCLLDIGELTVLQWAAIRGHAKLIELAISNGAEIDVPYSGNKTLFGLRVLRHFNRTNFRSPGIFADDSLNYNYENRDIWTPLFLAACCRHMNAIEVLLDHGASTNHFGGDMTPAHVAAAQGSIACMQAFVRPGFDINVRGARGHTFLHDAILGGVEMMEYILQLDGGTNLVNAKDKMGQIPLHSTCRTEGKCHYRRSQVELLLKHGSDIYARDNSDYTPAHIFAYWGDSICLQVLIDAGYDLHTRGKCGKTVLHCARWCREETVGFLLGLEEGRDIIDVEDDHQLTALDYALRDYNWRVEEVLLHHNARRKSSNAMLQVLNTACCDNRYPTRG